LLPAHVAAEKLGESWDQSCQGPTCAKKNEDTDSDVSMVQLRSAMNTLAGDAGNCSSLGAACCGTPAENAYCTGDWLNCNNDPKKPVCMPCGDADSVCCASNGRAVGAVGANDYCKEQECDDTNICKGDACGGSGQKCCPNGPSKCRDDTVCYRGTCTPKDGKLGHPCIEKPGKVFECTEPGPNGTNSSCVTVYDDVPVCFAVGTGCSCHAATNKVGCQKYRPFDDNRCGSSCYQMKDGSDDQSNEYCPTEPPFAALVDTVNNCKWPFKPSISNSMQVVAVHKNAGGMCYHDGDCGLTGTCTCKCVPP